MSNNLLDKKESGRTLNQINVCKIILTYAYTVYKEFYVNDAKAI